MEKEGWWKKKRTLNREWEVWLSAFATVWHRALSLSASVSLSVIWLLSLVELTSESSMVRLMAGSQPDPWRHVLPPSVACGCIHSQSPVKTHCLAVYNLRISCQSWAVLRPAWCLFIIHPVTVGPRTTESDSGNGIWPPWSSQAFGFSKAI